MAQILSRTSREPEPVGGHRGRPMLTERFFSATLGPRSSAHRVLFEGRGHGASARVLNDEAWGGFRSSSFGEKPATRIACGRVGTSCPMAVLVQSVRRESR